MEEQLLTFPEKDRRDQGQNRKRKGLGAIITKAHLLRYVKSSMEHPAVIPARLTRQFSPGKILQDANTVASSGIEEKGFIVCMTQKVGFSENRMQLMAY